MLGKTEGVTGHFKKRIKILNNKLIQTSRLWKCIRDPLLPVVSFLACFSETANTHPGWRLGSAQMQLKFIQNVSSHVSSVKGVNITIYYNCIRTNSLKRILKHCLEFLFFKNSPCQDPSLPTNEIAMMCLNHENIQMGEQNQVFLKAFKITVCLCCLSWQHAEHNGKPAGRNGRRYISGCCSKQGHRGIQILTTTPAGFVSTIC